MTSRLRALERLYEQNSDPWNFQTSDYEKQKFVATRAALNHRHFNNVLELGCSNGELASYLAPQATNYTGLDAITKPLEVAKLRAPKASFEKVVLPAMPLSLRPFDLIVLSEILYFLSAEEIAKQAAFCTDHSPRAEYLLVNFLGETERELQGKEALDLFKACLVESHRHQIVSISKQYRIDWLQPVLKLKTPR